MYNALSSQRFNEVENQSRKTTILQVDIVNAKYRVTNNTSLLLKKCLAHAHQQPGVWNHSQARATEKIVCAVLSGLGQQGISSSW